MAYIAWVRYGTSNSGCDEYLTTSSLSGALMLSPLWFDKATKFPTVEAAKEAVHTWCTKRRAELERINIHSGKSWNQTREGAWKYREVEDTSPDFDKPTTIWEF
jgi:hypothetical protein